MAEAIPFYNAHYDRREILFHKLQNAPKEHVEALLDSYEILQLLHDKGLLEVTKGLLGSGEKVLEVLTKTMTTEEAIALFRNLTVLVKILGGINPEILEDVQHALSKSVDQARQHRSPGFFSILTKLFSPGTLRFVGTAAVVMNVLGRNLGKAKEPGMQGKRRQMVTRRNVLMVPNKKR
jgi:uncharacterized protein YjgD (DUF1641 family)